MNKTVVVVNMAYMGRSDVPDYCHSEKACHTDVACEVDAVIGWYAFGRCSA